VGIHPACVTIFFYKQKLSIFLQVCSMSKCLLLLLDIYMGNNQLNGILILGAMLLLVIVVTRCMSGSKAVPCKRVATIGGVVVIGERICNDGQTNTNSSD